MLEEHLAKSFIARLEKKAKMSKEKDEESGEDKDSEDSGKENLAEEEREEGTVSIQLQNGVAEVIQLKLGGEESKSREPQLDSQTTSTKVRNRMIKNYHYKSQASKMRCPFKFISGEVSDLCFEASKQVFENIDGEGYERRTEVEKVLQLSILVLEREEAIMPWLKLLSDMSQSSLKMENFMNFCTARRIWYI